MPSNIFFLLLSLLIFVMKEKYAALWLLVSATIIVLALFPHLLSRLAELTGVVMPVNLLFMLAIMMLIGICLHLTLDLSRLGEDTRTLAEEVAMLRAQLEQESPRKRPSGGQSAPEEVASSDHKK